MGKILKKYIFLLLITNIVAGTHLAYGLESQSKSQEKFNIIFLGDSLTAGYGIHINNAFPKILENKLQKHFKNLKFKVQNAGISGSTTASAESRLKWLLNAKPRIILLALGANDGLRGISVRQTKENLEKTIKLAQKNNIEVILAGMKLPKNYGKKFVSDFSNIFPDLAKKYKLPFIPFLLKDVAGVDALNLADRIHPNEKGHQKITENIMPYFIKTIQKLSDSNDKNK